MVYFDGCWMLVGAGLLLPVKQSRALPVVGKVEDGSRGGGKEEEGKKGKRWEKGEVVEKEGDGARG